MQRRRRRTHHRIDCSMRSSSAAARPVWRSPGTSNAKACGLSCWRLDLNWATLA